MRETARIPARGAMLTDGPDPLAESHHQPISLVGRLTKAWEPCVSIGPPGHSEKPACARNAAMSPSERYGRRVVLRRKEPTPAPAAPSLLVDGVDEERPSGRTRGALQRRPRALMHGHFLCVPRRLAIGPAFVLQNRRRPDRFAGGTVGYAQGFTRSSAGEAK